MSNLLKEMGKWHSAAIERQLAHAMPSTVLCAQRALECVAHGYPISGAEAEEIMGVMPVRPIKSREY
ncbi:hypothetical protein [Sphingobium sp. YC-XJ3]|uniref:hypothetical protein n=1 Tax=Sphingobium sp. YC-XJ3 TaxID=3024245 RepID=UPI002361197E|nr:hypothetical protein [Sphingobium sp. YC-XJ3]WDA36137.1 hypothetical protein PO876_22305 [Sphingobium sp. YC-XJ3]